MRPAIRGLYLIADTGWLPDGERLLAAVAAAVRGGAALVQYRDKRGPGPARLRLARGLLGLCRAAGVPLIVNDDLTLARAIGADGVHLGRGDPAIRVARRALGADVIVGASCYNEFARAVDAQREGADYVAFGSFYASPTKPDAVTADAALLERARRDLAIPPVAIGGITPHNGAGLIAAGAVALAVASGVLAQSDPEAAARRYARLFGQGASGAGEEGLSATRLTTTRNPS